MENGKYLAVASCFTPGLFKTNPRKAAVKSIKARDRIKVFGQGYWVDHTQSGNQCIALLRQSFGLLSH
jgi:hypothetical protein